MNDLICVKCKVKLETASAQFEYLGHVFRSNVLKCPVCGQVHLSEELVRTRIKHLEEAVEDK